MNILTVNEAQSKIEKHKQDTQNSTTHLHKFFLLSDNSTEVYVFISLCLGRHYMSQKLKDTIRVSDKLLIFKGFYDLK